MRFQYWTINSSPWDVMPYSVYFSFWNRIWSCTTKIQDSTQLTSKLKVVFKISESLAAIYFTVIAWKCRTTNNTVILERQKVTSRVKHNKTLSSLTQTHKMHKVPNVFCNSDSWKVNCLQSFDNIHVKLVVSKNHTLGTWYFSYKLASLTETCS